MAEFPELGKHCQVKSCQQLDFLPFLCKNCCGTFCVEHRTKASHCCTFTEKGNEFKKGCLAKDEPKIPMQCTFEECKCYELMPVICEHCHNIYCLRHRHQVDHQCQALPQKQTRLTPEERIQQIIGKDLSKEKKGRGGVRNESRAAKVSLMKIKMKATGDACIPQDDRVYLRVLLPLGSQERELPMFFSKRWTVGKIIDKIAAAAKLTNANNVNTVERKLRLIHRSTGEVLEVQDSFEHFQTRRDCPLLSGATVIIEYVGQECTSVIPNLDNYPT